MLLMNTLKPDECRVLGVLIEKAQTTPGQYPLTLNALVSGCNQKSNREPMTSLGEEDVLAALDSLRAKQFAREVLLSGSRVGKYRHNAREGLVVETSELVLLAELLLRGPQSVGELRGRATRMHPLESIEVVETLLEGLISRDPPLVRRLPPTPGTRAKRYTQLLCPDLHPVDVHPTPRTGSAGPASDLEERVAALETDLASLRLSVERLAGVPGRIPVE